MASSMELQTKKKKTKKIQDERPGGDSIREQTKQLTNNRCNMRVSSIAYEQNTETSILIYTVVHGAGVFAAGALLNDQALLVR